MFIACILILFYIMFIKISRNVLDVVIAYYNDDLKKICEYIKEVTTNQDVIVRFKVYVKSTEKVEIPDNIDNIEIIYLPNLGRESNTYMTYIVENYNFLPNYILFIPGKFEKHEDRILTINKLKDLKSVTFFCGKRYNDAKSFTINKHDGVNLIPANPRGLFEWAKTYNTLKSDENKDILTGLCHSGSYLTTRDNILKRSKTFYKRILTETEIGKDTEAAHYMERLGESIYG